LKVLITGGLGHIGSHLTKTLPTLIEGCELVVVDNLLTQRYSSLFSFNQTRAFTFFEESVENLSVEWFESHGPFDVVIHLAAITDAAGNVDNREGIYSNNFSGTRNLSEICLATDTALIFPSSTSVYGTQESVVDESCNELRPQSPYAECKLAEEKILLESSMQGLRVTILRLGTIHGASIGMRFHTAVNRFIFQTKLGLDLTVWRTALNQKRPYLSLSDVSAAIAHTIKLDLFQGDIFNIVTANWTVQEIINHIEANTESECAIKLVDTAIMNQLSYEVSSNKFQDTGFSFSGNLDQDIGDTWSLLSGFRDG